jgi:predicted nucleic acid-binding Zn ribbon protein
VSSGCSVCGASRAVATRLGPRCWFHIPRKGGRASLTPPPHRTHLRAEGSVTVACGGDGSFGCARAFTASAALQKLPPCPRCGRALSPIPSDWVPARLLPLPSLVAAIQRHASCTVCGKPLPKRQTGRRSRFCSNACRQQAHRARQGEFRNGEGSEGAQPSLSPESADEMGTVEAIS